MKGFVVKFDAEKGFGFIRWEGYSGDDAFVHISKIEGKKVLEPGQSVTFDLGQSDKGPVAENVVPGRKRTSPYMLFFVLGVIVILGSIWTTVHYLKAPWGISYLIGVNLAIFFLYGYDKKVAGGKKLLRVPEKILHLFTFLGGTPMAFFSQSFFRHKTIKGSFRIAFWAIFLLQIFLLWQFRFMFYRGA